MTRIARLATVALLNNKDSEPMSERALSAVDEAAQWKPDLIVLPEEIDIVGLPPEEVAMVGEPIPGGPIYERFAERAGRHGVNIVIGLREREGERLYNVGALINRQGEFVGKYRKTHLAPGESHEITQGDEYPVFELDFGRVGVMICMDIHYPEPWCILALQGADVIAHPTMWRDYTGDMCESLVNARAIDNQVYVATSHYVTVPFVTGVHMGHSRIVDPCGRTRASTSHRPGVAVVEVDLDEGYEYWAAGSLKKQYPTLKECFLGMRRPETYGIITRSDEENAWKIENPTLRGTEVDNG